MKHNPIILTVVAILTLLYSAPYAFSVEADNSDKPIPIAFTASDTFEHPPVVEGKEVVHDYVIQNRGNAELKIEKVKTD